MAMIPAEEVAAAVEAAIAAPRLPRPKLEPKPAPSKFSGDQIARFRQMWSELHARPFADGFVLGDDAAWMEAFTLRLPCGECRPHWRQLLAETPPTYYSREDFYAWTVAAHNAVNRRLGKPEFSVAQARLMERA